MEEARMRMMILALVLAVPGLAANAAPPDEPVYGATAQFDDV
jgi:hypothetical protein